MSNFDIHFQSAMNRCKAGNINHVDNQCVKSVHVRSFSGPYSVRMWEDTDQKNSEYGHFSRSEFPLHTAKFEFY